LLPPLLRSLFSSHARARLPGTAPTAPPTRAVSEAWDERQRRQFVEIALRAKGEVCASYTLVALGLQGYRENQRAAGAGRRERPGSAATAPRDA